MKFGRFHMKSLKSAVLGQICHIYMVFHRVHMEGQLGISYFLVVHGGVWWCMVVFGGTCGI